MNTKNPDITDLELIIAEAKQVEAFYTDDQTGTTSLLLASSIVKGTGKYYTAAKRIRESAERRLMNAKAFAMPNLPFCMERPVLNNKWSNNVEEFGMKVSDGESWSVSTIHSGLRLRMPREDERRVLAIYLADVLPTLDADVKKVIMVIPCDGEWRVVRFGVNKPKGRVDFASGKAVSDDLVALLDSVMCFVPRSSVEGGKQIDGEHHIHAILTVSLKPQRTNKAYAE